jgi:fluoride exporter
VQKVFLIALGGALGSVLRYLMSAWMQRLANGTFPFGTLTVNVIGCLLIGFLNALFFGPFLIRAEYRLAVTAGILGGFTTFSSFGWETLSFINDGEWMYAAANVAANNILGLAAAWGGYRLAVAWFGA